MLAMAHRGLLAAAAAAIAVAGISAAASGAARTDSRAAANGRIVFVAGGNGIASMNPDGSGIWSLALGGSDGDPAWSPDGSRLAVAVRWPGSEGITVMDPDGWTNRFRLTFSAGDASPSWSPDGTAIAYSTGSGRIAVVRAQQGAQPRELTGETEWAQAPAWSPDGSAIAFTTWGPDGAELRAVDPATGRETRLVDVPGASSPSWSPRGELTYLVGTTAFLRSADGTDAQLLANVDWASRIAWSPDGARFLFVREGAVWLADRSGTVLGRLARGSAAAWQPLAPAPGDCTLWGTASADILVGSPGHDVICGLDGNDTVVGLDGDDELHAGGGDDWVAGGRGFDVLDGGDGNDRVDGRDGGPDFVGGGAGFDTGLLERLDTARGVERRRLDGDLAAWRPVRASGDSIVDPAVRIVDGRVDDYWNSGGWPPQWIEVDLLRPVDVGRIRLVAGPQGENAIHLVLGKGRTTRGAFRLLGTMRGPSADGQELVLRPKRAWRGIRTIRVESLGGGPGTGWVSWHEIEVFAAPRHR